MHCYLKLLGIKCNLFKKGLEVNISIQAGIPCIVEYAIRLYAEKKKKNCYRIVFLNKNYPSFIAFLSLISLQVAHKYGMPSEMIKNLYKKTRKG